LALPTQQHQNFRHEMIERIVAAELTISGNTTLVEQGLFAFPTKASTPLLSS